MSETALNHANVPVFFVVLSAVQEKLDLNRNNKEKGGIRMNKQNGVTKEELQLALFQLAGAYRKLDQRLTVQANRSRTTLKQPLIERVLRAESQLDKKHDKWNHEHGKLA